MKREPSRHPAWILCRRMDAFPVPDNDVLRLWAERGRIHPDDYLVNPRLDKCFQAKDIAELKSIFHKAAVLRFEKISCALSMATFAILCIRLITS